MLYIYICITNGSPCTPWRTPTGHFYCSLTIHLCKELEVWGPQIRSVNLRLLYVPLLAKKRGLHGQAFPAKPGMQGLFLQNIWSIFWTPTTKIHHSNSCLQKRQELFFFHFRERTAFRSTEETAEVQKVPVGRLGDLKVWRTGKLDNKGTTSKNLENSIEPSLSSVLFRASISGAFRWRACFILHPVNVNLYYGPKIYLQRQKKWPLAGFCWKNNCFCFQMQIEYFHWTASLHRFGLLGRQGGKRATSNGSGEASPQGEIGASERQEGCQNEGFRFCG